MLSFFTKPCRFAIAYSIFLTCLASYALLDAFVIPKAQVQVAQGDPQTSNFAPASSALGAGTALSPDGDPPVITETSYKDARIQITIEQGRAFDSTYYVADIRLSSADYVKTALAEETFGRNIRQATSTMADAHNAILAVNGDYYGFRDTGWVLRNGTLYRSSGSGQSGEALLIDRAGNFAVENENQLSVKELEAQAVQQVFSFGPGLVVDGEIVATGTTAKGGEKHPRTAIGQVSALHYVMIVVDGRTTESRGVTLAELAQLLVQYECETGYNLDGGGSSTMVFNGKVINQPTDGRRVAERQVSDIVYIGYE